MSHLWAVRSLYGYTFMSHTDIHMATITSRCGFSALPFDSEVSSRTKSQWLCRNWTGYSVFIFSRDQNIHRYALMEAGWYISRAFCAGCYNLATAFIIMYCPLFSSLRIYWKIDFIWRTGFECFQISHSWVWEVFGSRHIWQSFEC